MRTEPVETAQITAAGDPRLEEEDRFKGSRRRRRVIEEQQQAGDEQHQKGSKGQPPQAEGVTEPQVLPEHHPGEEMLQKVLDHIYLSN